MAIKYNEKGLLILDIPATGNNLGKTLPNTDFYFNTLNEESYAFSNIDNWGAYTDPIRFDGYFIENNPNEFGIILGHEFSPFIYRGQNQDYPNFIPTANRYELEKETEQLRHCIDWVKKQEFLQLFQKTPYFERCQNFQVLNCKFKFDLDAIAQHYEFISNYIDITKDLFVALFFVYTYQEKGQYFPITDFERYSPTLYIGNLKKIYKHNPKSLKIIGFQALLRPHLQKAMAIEINMEDNTKSLFEKIELPKSYAFASEIFSKANCGKNLFPNDFMSNVAQQIKQEKNINIENLKEYCKLYKYDINVCIDKLKKYGYGITTDQWRLPANVMYSINREIDDNIIPYLNDKIGYRGVSEPLYRNERIEGTVI